MDLTLGDIRSRDSRDTFVHKFGRNSDMALNTAETLWETGGIYVFPAAASVLSVVSSDAADASPSGGGARTVRINGLDANYLPITETVALNGLTPVLTSKQFLRFDLADVATAGGPNANTGIITITHGALTMCSIAANTGRSQTGIFTVQASHEGWLLGLGLAATRQQGVNIDVDLYVRPFGETFQIWDTFSVAAASGTVPYRPVVPYIIPAKSDIRFDGKATANNAAGSVLMSIFERNQL